MNIAWRQKVTLVDYPDKVATIIFTPWCNLRCRFCHNPELVLPRLIEQHTMISEEVFFDFLHRRVWMIDGVVISGGEPTIHRDILNFCRTIKQMWFFVKLDTNGRDPVVVQTMIDTWIVDFIAMDIKIDHTKRHHLLQTKEHYNPYIQTIKILINSSIDYEFRTTLIKPYHNHQIFKSMLSLIQGARRYALQTYRPQITLDQDFDGKSFSFEEMQNFQTIAQNYVKYCEIR